MQRTASSAFILESESCVVLVVSLYPVVLWSLNCGNLPVCLGQWPDSGWLVAAIRLNSRYWQFPRYKIPFPCLGLFAEIPGVRRGGGGGCVDSHRSADLADVLEAAAAHPIRTLSLNLQTAQR